MAIDLSQFHQVFFEESIEGLDIMESALMELDPLALDLETINSIFRAAHSIKGGSATFGFRAIAEFTHDMETILDQVRDGRRSITADDINLFLQSVDCMREMLSLLQDGQDCGTDTSQLLQEKFSNMLTQKSVDGQAAVTEPPSGEVSGEVSGESTEDGGETAENKDPGSAADTAPVAGAEDEAESSSGFEIWNLQFAPGADILKTGNDVVPMFRELAKLGEIKTLECSAELPGFSELDPEHCYLKWDITIVSDRKQEELLAVFEWVEDDSKIVTESAGACAIWEIDFTPGPDILRTGNEPIRLFTALEELGELQVRAIVDALPGFSDLHAEQSFLSWQLKLQSNESTTSQDIYEVFEWVVDEAKLEIRQQEDSEGKSPAENQPEQQPDNVIPLEAAKPAPEEKTAAAPKESPKAPVRKKSGESSSIRVGIDKIDTLINMVGELVITQSMLGQLGTDFDIDNLPKLVEGLGQLEQNTRELQESVMRIRMLPISFAFSRFPRMVRDLSQQLGKSIDLKMLGEQTELDKTVMEKIGDPLVHLVRNAVDHGIELPAEREANGKPGVGQVMLNAYHQSGNVVIEIKDDGKGLDEQLLLNKAIEKGVIQESEAAHLHKEQILDLIFHPGFSTAKTVSDVSGRGVGMDVVKKNIQSLNGMVEVKSEKGSGSTFTIRLPLTLAILDGQLVRVGNSIYIFPLVSIVESMQYKDELVNNIAGGCNVFQLREEYVPTVELHKAFSIPATNKDMQTALMVVVETEGEKVGIIVDELLAQQQVVIKSLENNYKRVEGISGATILGDGTVALILDIPGIVKLAGEKFTEAQTFIQSQKRAEYQAEQAVG